MSIQNSQKLIPACVVALVGVSLIGTSAAPAQAAPATDPHESPIAAVHAQMQLDCTSLTGEQEQYAIAHDYCPAPSKHGDVTTMGVRYGDCGDSWIYMFAASGPTVDIDYGFTSNKGPVIYRALAIGYAGSDAIAGWRDDRTMASASYSSGRSDVYTGYGSASATLGGTITLAWGARCTLLEPTDSATT